MVFVRLYISMSLVPFGFSLLPCAALAACRRPQAPKTLLVGIFLFFFSVQFNIFTPSFVCIK